MKLTLCALSILSSIGLVAAGCDYGPYNKLDNQNQVHDCFIGYRNGQWHGDVCGGKGWFKGGENWNSPDDCYDSCAKCVFDGINKKAQWTTCSIENSGWSTSKCWIGYNNL